VSVRLWKPVTLLKHRLVSVFSFFVFSFALLLVAMLMITVYNRVRDVLVQYLRQNGNSQCADQEATHEGECGCLGRESTFF
jgi:hypothetical protein